MSCAEIRPQLSPLVDGDLDGPTERRLRQHLAGCPACREEEALCRRLIALTASLPSLEPPAALWTRIEARLEEPPRPLAWLRWPRLRFLVPAGFAFAAAAVVAAVAWERRSALPSDEALLADAQAELGRAESHYRKAATDLRLLAERERAGWPEAKRRRFDQQLAALDRAVDEARGQSRRQRLDLEPAEGLFGAYARQIAFLEESILGSAQVEP